MSKLRTINDLLGRLAVVRDRWPDSKDELIPIIEDATSSQVVPGNKLQWVEWWRSHSVLGNGHDDAFRMIHQALSEERKFIQVPDGMLFPNEHATSMILSRVNVKNPSEVIKQLASILDYRKEAAENGDVAAVVRFNNQIERLLGL